MNPKQRIKNDVSKYRGMHNFSSNLYIYSIANGVDENSLFCTEELKFLV